MPRERVCHDRLARIFDILEDWQGQYFLQAGWCRQQAIQYIENGALASVYREADTLDEWGSPVEGRHGARFWLGIATANTLEVYLSVSKECPPPEGWLDYQPMNQTRDGYFKRLRSAIGYHLDKNPYARADILYGDPKSPRNNFIKDALSSVALPYCEAVEKAYISRGCMKVSELPKAEEHLYLTAMTRLMGADVKWKDLASTNRLRGMLQIELRRIQKAVRGMLRLLDLPLTPTFRLQRGRPRAES